MRTQRTISTSPTSVMALLWFGAGLIYSLWVLGPWINPSLDQLDGYVSEFAARDQPGAWLFQAGDTATGVLVLAGLAIGVGGGVASRWERVGWAGAGVFGLATAVDGVVTPMDCAAYVDPGCAARELVGALSVTHDLHAVSSGIAGIGAIAAMLGLGLGARVNPAVGLPSRWLLVLSGVTAVAAVATCFAMLAGSWTGVVQRVQLVEVSVWLISCAVCWHWSARDPSAHPPPVLERVP